MLIEQSVDAVKLQTGKGFFEIFGYDFIIDAEMEAWLIEINTNPCLEESSPLLQLLLPRMMNDALKLTVDLVFTAKKSQAQYDTARLNQFEVSGYDNGENMWKQLKQKK